MIVNNLSDSFAYFTLIIMCFIILAIIGAPRIYLWFLDFAPLCLVFPKTKEGALLKKYADKRAVDKNDWELLYNLKHLGCVELITRTEGFCYRNARIISTAETTNRGMFFLRHYMI